jgi:hypothetical protein
MEPRPTKFHDDAGRELEAILPDEGFIWELWLDLETKDAIVKAISKQRLSHCG